MAKSITPTQYLTEAQLREYGKARGLSGAKLEAFIQYSQLREKGFTESQAKEMVGI